MIHLLKSSIVYERHDSFANNGSINQTDKDIYTQQKQSKKRRNGKKAADLFILQRPLL
jgi:hypothetical protein